MLQRTRTFATIDEKSKTNAKRNRKKGNIEVVKNSLAHFLIYVKTRLTQREPDEYTHKWRAHKRATRVTP